MNNGDAFRTRAEALLHLKDYKGEVAPTTPEASATGALDSVAYAWRTNSTVATVYEFDSYDSAASAEQELQHTAQEGRIAKSTVNGSLLLWATATTDDEPALALLEQLVSSFAGRE